MDIGIIMNIVTKKLRNIKQKSNFKWEIAVLILQLGNMDGLMNFSLKINN